MRLDRPDKSIFVEKLNSARRTATPSDIDELFVTLEWRGRMTAAWIAGLNRWSQFQNKIGELLVESECCFSGEGYCVALALFQNEQSSESLKAYLDRYLPQTDKYYDQDWALSALVRLDEMLGSDFATEYREPSGLWDRFIVGKTDHGAWNLAKSINNFKSIMEECSRLFPPI